MVGGLCWLLYQVQGVLKNSFVIYRVYASGNHQNKMEALQCLLRCGADVNMVSSIGHSCLHTSLYYHQFDTARSLIRAGADVTRTDYLGNCPLSLVLAQGNLDMANIIIAAGAPCTVSSSQR